MVACRLVGEKVAQGSDNQPMLTPNRRRYRSASGYGSLAGAPRVFHLRCVKSPAVPPRLRAALCILVLLTVAATGARAQSPVSGIAGTVRDSLGVPLDLVVVEAHDPATGYAARTATNRAGRYILLGLPLGGPYAVRARRVGFVPAERGGVVLTIGARPSVDFVLSAAVP